MYRQRRSCCTRWTRTERLAEPVASTQLTCCCARPFGAGTVVCRVAAFRIVATARLFHLGASAIRFITDRSKRVSHRSWNRRTQRLRRSRNTINQKTRRALERLLIFGSERAWSDRVPPGSVTPPSTLHFYPVIYARQNCSRYVHGHATGWSG